MRKCIFTSASVYLYLTVWSITCLKCLFLVAKNLKLNIVHKLNILKFIFFLISYKIIEKGVTNVEKHETYLHKSIVVLFDENAA